MCIYGIGLLIWGPIVEICENECRKFEARSKQSKSKAEIKDKLISPSKCPTWTAQGH